MRKTKHLGQSGGLSTFGFNDWRNYDDGVFTPRKHKRNRGVHCLKTRKDRDGGAF